MTDSYYVQTNTRLNIMVKNRREIMKSHFFRKIAFILIFVLILNISIQNSSYNFFVERVSAAENITSNLGSGYYGTKLVRTNDGTLYAFLNDSSNDMSFIRILVDETTLSATNTTKLINSTYSSGTISPLCAIPYGNSDALVVANWFNTLRFYSLGVSTNAVNVAWTNWGVDYSTIGTIGTFNGNIVYFGSYYDYEVGTYDWFSSPISYSILRNQYSNGIKSLAYVSSDSAVVTNGNYIHDYNYNTGFSGEWTTGMYANGLTKRSNGDYIIYGATTSNYASTGKWRILTGTSGNWSFDPQINEWQFTNKPITYAAALNDNRIVLVGNDCWQIINSDNTYGESGTLNGINPSSIVIGNDNNSFIVSTDSSGNLVKVKLNENPSIDISSPMDNSSYSEIIGYKDLILQGTVTDTNTGDILTVKYNIDEGLTQNVQGTVTTTGAFTTTNIDVSSLSEGSHNINVWVEDNVWGISSITTIPFKVDKSMPIIDTFLPTSTTSSMTISGSATDAIAGLDAFPYRYTIGTNEPTAWLTNTSYTQDGLEANTQYNVAFEVRDVAGNIATNTSSVYTKAIVPSLSNSNFTPYSLNLATSDNNPTNTQYQISVNNGAQYITPEGTFTASPVWITLPSKNITVTGLSPSTTYTFTAKAKNDEGIETEWSAPISGTTLIQPPSAPVNITAAATSSSISVVWDPAASSTGYDIEVDGTIIDNGTYTSYNHMGLTPYTQHTYRVRAKNEGGTGAWSEEISKYTQQDTPLTPFNIDAAATNTAVIVTWQPIVGATAYDIEVDGVVINNSSSTNYVHSGLLSGTMHGYRVRSINSGGKSDWSNEILISTLTDTPIVPSNISATPESGQITVAWDSIPGATYEIEVDGNIKDNGTSNSFVHTELLPGSSHSYRVRTNQSGSLSDWSVAVTAAIPIEEFGTPKNIKAEATDTTITMSWSPVVDATGYDVEVDGIVLDNGTETACVFNSLTTNTQYTYRIRAKGTDKVSDWSEPIAVTTFALPTPTNIISAAADTSISLTWDTIAGAESYELDIDGQLVEGITTNSYIHEGLASNTQHSYRIRAKNASGTSNWSSIINEATLSNALDAPTGIIVKSMTSSIQLVWKPVPEVDSYEVEIDGTTVESVTAATYIQSGLTAGTQHSYRVRAIKDTVPGSWSNTAIAFTLPDTPLTPSNIAVSSTMSSILITWDGVDNAIEYEIEVDGVIINSGLNTKYLHNNLTPDSTHTYKVRANSSVAQSPWSEAITTNTKSSVNTYTLSVSNGQVFNLMLTANEIVDPTNYTYTITYNPDELEMLDLCALTSRIDLNTGNLIGTDIQIVQFTQGTIVFKKLGDSTGQAWTGLVNSIKFKGKTDGESQITYSIQ